MRGCSSWARGFTVALSILAGADAVAAQEVRRLSLADALELAGLRSEDVGVAQAGVMRAEGEQRRVRADRYPQFASSGSYDRTLASEFSGLFQPQGPPPCPPLSVDPTGPIGERLTELERALTCGAQLTTGDGLDFGNLPFGREHAWRVNVLFSQTVWTGGRIGAQLRLADAALETAGTEVTTTRAQAQLDVARAFYDALLSERLVLIARTTLEQAETVLRLVEAARQAGAQPEFELLRARVARDTQRPILIRREADRELASLRLKQLLDIPSGETLELVADLDAALEPLPGPLELRAVEVAERGLTERRLAERQAALQVRQRAAGVDLAQTQRFPTVSVNSLYGGVAYAGLPAFGDFRANWTIGAAVSWPIFTGGRIGAETQIARAELNAAELRLRQAQELAALDTQSVLAELRAARAAWEASAGTVEEATRAYEIAELRYREGVSNLLELTDARVLLEQARALRAQSARDLQVARVHAALLPDLPVAPGVPGAVPAGGFAGGGSAPARSSPFSVTSGQPSTGGAGAPTVPGAPSSPGAAGPR